ncbi:kinase-like domain-containing protein [Xylaria acuta]|nr:kinase-like domain-containing protein [Xylaria acuta]
MPGTFPTQNGTGHQPDASGVWPGWTSEYPVVTTQSDGRIRIQEYGILFENDHTRPRFYPLLLLQHVFTREVLSAEINALQGLDASEKDLLVERVLGSDNSSSETYIRVFAILKVIDQLKRLPAFVREGVSDQELPLHWDHKQPGDHLFYGKPEKRVPDDLLSEYGRASFHREQYNMLVPFFESQSHPYEFAWAHVLPSYEVTEAKTSTSPSELEGSYGVVSKILIHPLCHNFHNVFDALGMPDEEMFFAVKQFHDNDPASFRREVEMLQRFNSAKHSHIVALLAAYTKDSKDYLIFPWATHDLHAYWKKVRPTPDAEDVELVRWICHQAWMLVEAVSRMHKLPEDQNRPEEKRLYGRHGDLKPENILWYKSREGFGKLVIADMGLSKVHRYESKTYIPGKKVSATPRYRPPEVEYEDGLMGRTFDIWTLGCMFLEMLGWLHGGYDQLTEMEEMITTPSIRGYDCNAYSEWVYVEDSRFYTVRVKKAVTEYIRTLRKDCSQFVYDFLDIIEYQMLVAERDDRATAENLAKEMENLHNMCHDEDGLIYCVRKEKRQLLDAPKPKLQERVFGKNLPTGGRNTIPRVVSSDFE